MMVTSDPLFPDALLAQVTADNPHSGAVVSFSGNVRMDKDDGNTCALILEAYHPVTSNGIAEAINTARSRWELDDVMVRHRTGSMKPGETIVFVAAAAKHRRDAFAATDFLMDYLKTEAFFWKKEVYENSEKWIEPRAQDYSDAKRWDKKS
ncbi:MAG: molybdenum cofactor biosynthesis protein MoaE [Maricaulaceae bacterium]